MGGGILWICPQAFHICRIYPARPTPLPCSFQTLCDALRCGQDAVPLEHHRCFLFCAGQDDRRIVFACGFISLLISIIGFIQSPPILIAFEKFLPSLKPIAENGIKFAIFAALLVVSFTNADCFSFIRFYANINFFDLFHGIKNGRAVMSALPVSDLLFSDCNYTTSYNCYSMLFSADFYFFQRFSV